MMGLRLALITGGSRGLGAALCAEYRGKGWQVVEFSRTAPHPFSVRVDLADPPRTVEVFTAAFATARAVQSDDSEEP